MTREVVAVAAAAGGRIKRYVDSLKRDRKTASHFRPPSCCLVLGRKARKRDPPLLAIFLVFPFFSYPRFPRPSSLFSFGMSSFPSERLFVACSGNPKPKERGVVCFSLENGALVKGGCGAM